MRDIVSLEHARDLSTNSDETVVAAAVDILTKLRKSTRSPAQGSALDLASAALQLTPRLADTAIALYRRVQADRAEEPWLECDFPAPEGQTLTLGGDALPGLIRDALNLMVARVADGCDRLVVRFHLVNPTPDLVNNMTLVEIDNAGEPDVTRSVHPKLRAMADLHNENERLTAELARLTAERDLIAREKYDVEEALMRAWAERDRLQRACDEGLPRERIDCPACGKAHVEWFRHDAPGIDGRKRPHHTHRCYHCAHVWDSGRWSFGVDAPHDEVSALRSENAELKQRLHAAGHAAGHAATVAINNEDAARGAVRRATHEREALREENTTLLEERARFIKANVSLGTSSVAIILAATEQKAALGAVRLDLFRAWLRERGWRIHAYQNTFDGSPRPEHWIHENPPPSASFKASRLEVIVCDGEAIPWSAIVTAGDVAERHPVLVLADLLVQEFEAQAAELAARIAEDLALQGDADGASDPQGGS